MLSNESQVPERKIPSNGPLSILEPEKLITYLSSLTLTESKLEAVRWILESWKLDTGDLQNLSKADFEMIEEDYQLASFEMNGNLERLKKLNYPAFLEIALPNAQGTKYLALVSIDGETGVFGSVDKIEMPRPPYILGRSDIFEYTLIPGFDTLLIFLITGSPL